MHLIHLGVSQCLYHSALFVRTTPYTFVEMPGTSSQNTWMVGLILYFPAIYHHVEPKKPRKQTNASPENVCGEKCPGAHGWK